MFRRFATILVLAMWLGGFTFYAEVVIPTAAHVLGSERHVGFITQQVTRWLNLIGLAAMLVFVWNMTAEWPNLTKARRRWFGVAMGAMVAAHMGLFVTHPLIDQLLNIQAYSIRDFDRFERLHDVYLTLATTEWVAALVYMWVSLRAWQNADRLAATRAPAMSAPATTVNSVGR